MNRPCLGCGRVGPWGRREQSRCPACRRQHERTRQQRQPWRSAYRDPAYRSIPLIGRCVDCGATEDLTRDHEVPLSKGGTNAGRIVIRCRSCNARKGDREKSAG